ncbi:MAG: hypothetical protein B7C24_01425 [Bacteroidetes bacterium 4572_77]|nr:MAG: hypothetical protein B7C24_01425 [Bacteroidetes bacterium 4572_77]
MNKFIILIAILGSITVFGQSLDPNVSSSGGDYFQNDQNSLSWTIGETIISTLENDAFLTQGFHQDTYTVIGIKENAISDISINIFPNPTRDLLNIQYQSTDNKQEDIIIQLLDMSGRVLKEEKHYSSSQIIQINLQSYERAYYLLRIINKKQINTYKIVKS